MLLVLLQVAIWISVLTPSVWCYEGVYHCEKGRDVFVHLFEWKWSDIANECENFLANASYCAVQVSPPMEHRIVINDSGYKSYPWWQRYQPVSYKMTSRSGDENDFKDMVKRCNDVGVRIYVDAVINHMTGGGYGTGSAGSTFNGDTLEFPGVPYGSNDFHGCTEGECETWNCEIGDYNNQNEVRYCRLAGLRDLKGGSEYVRDMIVGYLNKLIDWGVAGFRMDAAKHMFPSDMNVIQHRLHDLNANWFPYGTRPYIFCEVIDLGGEGIPLSEYTNIARVTEFKYGMHLGDVIRKNYGQKLVYLKNFGAGWGFMHGLDAVVFIDNHDNQRGHGAGGFNRILTFFEAKMYKMATAFELAWDYGHVRLMSSYDWPRYIENGQDINDWMGPPSDSDGNTKDVSCFGEWICEHRWRQIFNMVKFHNRALGEPVSNWWDNGDHAIAFSRGSQAFIVINNEDFTIAEDLYTGLPDGSYCDVITCDNNVPPCGNAGGSCREPVTVIDGYAYISVPNDNDPMFAIHV